MLDALLGSVIPMLYDLLVVILLISEIRILPLRAPRLAHLSSSPLSGIL